MKRHTPKTYLEQAKEAIAERDAGHGLCEDENGDVIPSEQAEFDKATVSFEYTIGRLIDGLVDEVDGLLDRLDTRGKWTALIEWVGNVDRGPLVIHAVGEDAEAARLDVARQLRRAHGAWIEHDDDDAADEDNTSADEAYIVVMFPGHHEQVRF